MNRDHSVIFEIVSKYCISDSFVYYDGYSIYSKGFLPTVVDIMVVCLKFSHSSPFSSLISKMLMFTLAISCLTTSKFALIHGPNIPGSYAVLFFTASVFVSITSHIHKSLGQEDPLEKEMATHSSILAREIPWTEEPGGLELQRVRYN